MNIIKLVTKILVIIGLTTQLAYAKATSSPIVEGKDYTIATNPTFEAADKNKVNVKEFFSFTCIHCKINESMVERAIANNKKIDFERIHVAWDSTSEALAKINATIVITKQDKLYLPIFNAVFNNQNITDPKVLKAILSKNGLTDKQINDFMNTYNSFTVTTKVKEYQTLMNQYNITGTPIFVVANKYIVNPATPERNIEVVNYLVNKVSK